jgi:multiple antibiotic resistance protein
MWTFDFQSLLSAFIVLFAIIDVMGALPIFVDLRNRQKNFSASKSALFSFIILLIFFFAGEGILRLFSVDVSSFAVAGSLVIFVVACEMTFGVEILKIDGPGGNATFVPIVFPLLAGPGAFTALLSLKAEFSSPVILVALLLNMIFVYIVLRNIRLIEKLIGAGGIYVCRKFFGVILLAISVRLFVSNITSLLGN